MGNQDQFDLEKELLKNNPGDSEYKEQTDSGNVKKGFFRSRKGKIILGSLAVLVAVAVIGSILVFGKGGLFKGMIFTGPVGTGGIKIETGLQPGTMAGQQLLDIAPKIGMITCPDNQYYDSNKKSCIVFDAEKPDCDLMPKLAKDPVIYAVNAATLEKIKPFVAMCECMGKKDYEISNTTGECVFSCDKFIMNNRYAAVVGEFFYKIFSATSAQLKEQTHQAMVNFYQTLESQNCSANTSDLMKNDASIKEFADYIKDTANDNFDKWVCPAWKTDIETEYQGPNLDSLYGLWMGYWTASNAGNTQEANEYKTLADYVIGAGELVDAPSVVHQNVKFYSYFDPENKYCQIFNTSLQDVPSGQALDILNQFSEVEKITCSMAYEVHSDKEQYKLNESEGGGGYEVTAGEIKDYVDISDTSTGDTVQGQTTVVLDQLNPYSVNTVKDLGVLFVSPTNGIKIPCGCPQYIQELKNEYNNYAQNKGDKKIYKNMVAAISAIEKNNCTSEATFDQSILDAAKAAVKEAKASFCGQNKANVTTIINNIKTEIAKSDIDWSKISKLITELKWYLRIYIGTTLQDCGYTLKEKDEINDILKEIAIKYLDKNSEPKLGLFTLIESLMAHPTLNASLNSASVLEKNYVPMQCIKKSESIDNYSTKICSIKIALKPEAPVCIAQIGGEIEKLSCVTDKSTKICKNLVDIANNLSKIKDFTIADSTKNVIIDAATGAKCCSNYDGMKVPNFAHSWMCPNGATEPEADCAKDADCATGAVCQNGDCVTVTVELEEPDCTTLKAQLDTLKAAYDTASETQKEAKKKLLEDALKNKASDIAICTNIDPDDYVIAAQPEENNKCEGTDGFKTQFESLIEEIETFLAQDEYEDGQDPEEQYVDYLYESQDLYDVYKAYTAAGGVKCTLPEDFEKKYLPLLCADYKETLTTYKEKAEKAKAGTLKKEDLDEGMTLETAEENYKAQMQSVIDMYNYALKEKYTDEACDLSSYVTYLAGDQKNCAYFEAKLTEITTQMDGILNGAAWSLTLDKPENKFNELKAQLNALFDQSTTANSEYKKYLADNPKAPQCNIAKYNEYKDKKYVAYNPITCDQYKTKLTELDAKMAAAKTETEFKTAQDELKKAIAGAKALTGCVVDSKYDLLATKTWTIPVNCALTYDSKYSFYKINIQTATSQAIINTLTGQLLPIVTAAETSGCTVPADIKALLTYKAAATANCSIYEQEYTTLTQLIQAAPNAAIMEAYKKALQEKMTAAQVAGCVAPIQLIGVLAAEFTGPVLGTQGMASTLQVPQGQPVQQAPQQVYVQQAPAAQQAQTMGLTYPQGMTQIPAGMIPYAGIPANTGPETYVYGLIFFVVAGLAFTLRKKFYLK